MGTVYLASFIIYSTALIGCIGGSLCLFTAGYTYANIVRYRNEHDGEIDFVEVLRQMSPKYTKDNEYVSEENQNNEIDLLGDNSNNAEIV